MKNDEHPLIRALKGRQKRPEPALHLPNVLRTFTLNHHEIPGLPGRKPGESISVHLHGHVAHHKDTGKTVMNVSHVKPDSEEMTDKQYPDQAGDKVPMVRTQESHT